VKADSMSDGATRPVRPGFRRLLVGQAISSLGDWMGTIALMALVLELTGSPAAVGGVLALRLAPAVFAGPLVARFALGGHRKRTMLQMDVVRFALVLPIGWIDHLWLIYVLTFATELAGLVFLPARDAAVPELVADEDLPSANGLLLVTSYGNIPLGAGVFALVSVVLGTHSAWTFRIVFLIDAATYLASFVALSSLDLDGPDDAAQPGAPAVADPDDGEPSEERSGTAAYLDAFRHPLVRSVAPGLIAAIVGAGTLFSLGTTFVRVVLDAGNAEFGVLVAIFGVGGAGGVELLRRLDGGVSLAVVRRATVALGVVLAVMSMVGNLYIAYGVAVFFGAAGASAIVGGITLLQEQLDGDERTMGLAVVHTTFRFGMSASALAAGFVVEQVPKVHWWIVGDMRPASTVMFGAGCLIALGGFLVPRQVRVDEAVLT
jgi:predicted MFS family arabinose efflux permease